jgi:dynein heavy chain
MQQATDLIGGLAGERKRWTEDSAKFDATKTALVGDVAVGCAFVSYCGPFNQEFRDYIVEKKLTADLKNKDVPCSPSLDVISLLVDVSETSDWALAGLPGDPLSIQNGIVVTRSSRYPLLIDPQGQAIKWIRQHEAERLPQFGITALNNPRIKDQLEFAMAEGKALIVAGVEEELDPMLDPVLNKQWIQKGKSKYINLMDKLCEFQETFALYLITRLPNPHFSPEDQAKCVVVDFTVTRKGLEEQLLGRVIQKEQRSLEEQLSSVLNDVATNTKALLRLDELLLERLSANTGNLLDDEELIAVLAETKTKAVEVNEKLLAAGTTRASIDEKREQYRPAATRGSVLYFAIVDMSQVNVMYQTSLDQFQGLFDSSMDLAERASLASKRVANVIDTMTYIVYRYISRGLYEKDRLSFKLLVLFNILVTAGRLTPSEVTLFLKGGAALDINAVKPKPVPWLTDTAWLNIVQLSSDQGAVVFRSLQDDVLRDDAKWKAWYNDNEPERQPIPGNYQPRFEADPNGDFYRMLLVRSLREDRTILCVDDFITKMESIDVAGTKLPCMGEKFTQPVTETIEMTYNDMSTTIPIVYLLSAGADPTDTVETYARKKKKHITCVSMGEGQEPVALRAINAATIEGMWVMLQNCHLGLPFMEGLEELLGKIKVNEATLPDFRLFITTEPNPKFPIGLLQLAVKVTCQPPSGLRAGLMRSYTVIVDQDRLERVETAQWRVLVYALCFQHSVVQERRKYGAMGWCVPYEYNDGDINACLLFLERHLYQGALSWPTLQYMVAEVQYGGKITDDLDRRLFRTYANQWLTAATTKPGFAFRPSETLQKIENDFGYGCPPGDTHDDYAAFAKTLPSVDSPEVFGLHPNADLAFRNKEVRNLLATILETQPKGGGSSGGGPTREDVVYAKCEEILSGIPEDYVEEVYAKALDMSQPLDVFLNQEIQRLQLVIGSVRQKSNTILGAIRGEVVITQQIIDGINAIFDAKVPHDWVFSPAGDEVSWQAPTIGFWASGLGARDEQLRKWIAGKGRPKSYWFPGWSNAAGFLTAVQQEVTRRHRSEGWALDGVRVDSEVTEYDRAEQVRAPPPEGVYISGLSLDGAIWDKSGACVAEAKPKILFCEMPILFVTAVTKTAKKSSDLGPFGGFSCPVYKYVRRTDKYIIFMVNLPSQQKPDHWILRGVALLCFTS